MFWVPFVSLTAASAWWGASLNPNGVMASLLSGGIHWWGWPISGVLIALVLWYFLPARRLITKFWLSAFSKEEESFSFSVSQVILGGTIFVSWLALVAGWFAGQVRIPPYP